MTDGERRPERLVTAKNREASFHLPGCRSQTRDEATARTASARTSTFIHPSKTRKAVSWPAGFVRVITHPDAFSRVTE